MAENSKIEWTDSTFNPWIGCAKISPGCSHCYAEHETPVRVARANGRELWGKGAQRQRTSESNWKQPLKWDRESGEGVEEGLLLDKDIRRHRVFCASLSDWLDDEVPGEWRSDLLRLIWKCHNLDFLMLSKRIENFYSLCWSALFHAEEQGYEPGFEEWLRQWLDGETPPANVWIGTTVEDQKRADERIPLLLQIPAKVRFLSVEPMLEAIDLTRNWYSTHNWHNCLTGQTGMGRSTDISGEDRPIKGKIDWVINGGESGPKKRPIQLDWMRSIRDQCKAAGVAYFAKQIDKVQAIPNDLMIREFPNAASH